MALDDSMFWYKVCFLFCKKRFTEQMEMKNGQGGDYKIVRWFFCDRGIIQ
jgi:hypothetical protein